MTSEQSNRRETELLARLQAKVLLARRVEGDRLMLADEVMSAAISGSRHLTAGERAALQASPLTLRRFRTLAGQQAAAAKDAWSASAGMLRAASSAGPLAALATDDGAWTLHFIEGASGWQVVLAIDASAPFAARLMHEHALLRVVDGGGAVVLQGRLDADGELESTWPFETEPAAHFQTLGAAFQVEPVPT